MQTKKPTSAAAKAASPKQADAPKKAATKTAAPKSEGGKLNPLQKPLQPSSELSAVIGAEPIARGAAVSKIWDYIRKHELQNPENKREIIADPALRKVFGKDKVTMF
ncbi:MAG TPA: SWIB/MDM2 domain-containing protein, partial [Acetobacteraceae bacterium]|nr:SWIB/MDM2 domain-containing protein [Acetobacteraceae bacterium]